LLDGRLGFANSDLTALSFLQPLISG
jgi:hypothetical protein